MARWYFVLLGVLVGLGSAAGPAGAEGVAVELAGPAVPFARVEHVIERSQGTWVARVGKHLPAPFGRREGVGLLTDEAWASLVSELRGLGAFELASPRPATGRAVYQVRLDVGGQRHRFTVADPGSRPDGRHAAVIRLIRQVVEAHTGPIEAQDDPLLASEVGMLQVLTDAPAQVRVVGQGVEGRAPLRALRLPAGQHVVEVTPLEGGEVARYPVAIEVGRTTALKLSIAPPDSPKDE